MAERAYLTRDSLDRSTLLESNNSSDVIRKVKNNLSQDGFENIDEEIKKNLMNL